MWKIKKKNGTLFLLSQQLISYLMLFWSREQNITGNLTSNIFRCSSNWWSNKIYLRFWPLILTNRKSYQSYLTLHNEIQITKLLHYKHCKENESSSMLAKEHLSYGDLKLADWQHTGFLKRWQMTNSWQPFKTSKWRTQSDWPFAIYTGAVNPNFRFVAGPELP